MIEIVHDLTEKSYMCLVHGKIIQPYTVVLIPTSMAHIYFIGSTENFETISLRIKSK